MMDFHPQLRTALFLGAALVALLMSTPPVHAYSWLPTKPQYVFETIGAGTSLEVQAPTSILQDRQGFIWVGTTDGLYRCDSSEVLFYGKEQGLPVARVNQIIESPDGVLLVSLNNTIFRFDGTRFKRLDLSQDINLSPVDEDVWQHIAVDDSSSLLVGTAEGIVAVDLEGDAGVRTWAEADGLPSGEGVRALSVEGGTRVRFVTGHFVGVLDLKTGQISATEVEALTEGEIPIAVVRDGRGVVWLRTINRLLRLDPGSTTFVEEHADIAEASSGGIPTLDRSGQLMVPTPIGLFLHEDTGWRRVSSENGLLSSAVTTAYEDREEALWIGLGGVGLQRWRGRSTWRAWDRRSGLPDSGVWSALRDDRGRLWVGTNNGIGVWTPENETWTTIGFERGLVGRRCWKLTVGPDGWVWALFRRKGINRFHPDTLATEIVSIPQPAFGEDVLEMIRTPHGSMLIGCGKKLVEVDVRAGALHFSEFPGLDGLVGRIEEASYAPDGTLWVCGVNGVAVYDGVGWHRLGEMEGLKVNGVRNVIALSADEAWIGYREIEGVSHIQLDGPATTITHLTTADGLADDRVWMMGRDRDGRIWVGGSAGMSIISEDHSVTAYTHEGGLVWNDISQGSFSIDEQGGAFIGTSQGLALFQPHEHKTPPPSPGVVITSAKLGYEESIHQNNPIVPFARNTFQATFAGLTFDSRRRIRYRVQLVGRDIVPFDPTAHSVRYAALSAGKYTLEVWCQSARGIWSSRPATFSFTILTPWWQESWLRILGVLLFLGLIRVSFVWRTRRLEKARMQLEIAVAEKSAALARANEELKELSFTDPLTKLHNRRYFEHAIKTDVSRVVRESYSRTSSSTAHHGDLVFLIIDLDHFKRVNDVYGHATGDVVLVEAARRIAAAMREVDLVVRWGGEEFLALARDTQREDAARVAERILHSVGGTSIEIDGTLHLEITCSVGWSTLAAGTHGPLMPSYKSIINLADKALYAAKDGGRNRAVGLCRVGPAHETEADGSISQVALTGCPDAQLERTQIEGPPKPSRSSGP